MTEDTHTSFGRENHQYTLSDFRICVWWSGGESMDLSNHLSDASKKSLCDEGVQLLGQTAR
jgi:hypothetical protein